MIFVKNKNKQIVRTATYLIMLFLLFFAIIFIPANEVFAVTSNDYIPLVPIPGVTDQGTDLGKYLPNLYRLAIGLAAALSVIVLAYGGVRYMTSEVISSKSAAVQMMRNAVGGLVLALSSFLLLNTINPDLVKFNLVIDEAKYNKPPVEEIISGAEASLYQVLKLLQTEAAAMKARAQQSSAAVNQCYLTHEQIVNQEIRVLSEFMSIRRATAPATELAGAFQNSWNAFTSRINFLDIASVVPAATAAVAELVGIDTRNSPRVTRVRDALRVYMDTDIKAFTTQYLQGLSTEQKKKLFERTAKAGEDMYAVANSLIGGGDALVAPFTEYSYCGTLDPFANVLGTDGTLAQSLTAVSREWMDIFDTEEIIKKTPLTDVELAKKIARVDSCLTFYRQIVGAEEGFIKEVQGKFTQVDRVTLLNISKDSFKKGVAGIIQEAERQSTYLPPGGLDRLKNLKNSVVADVDKLVPTECIASIDQFGHPYTIENNPAGCGGTGQSQAIVTSYDPALCDPESLLNQPPYTGGS